MTQFIWRLVQLSRLGFALLFAVVCLRFTAVAASESIRDRIPELDAVMGDESATKSAEPSGKPSSGGAERLPSAAPVHMSVIVNMGGSRSEVFIDGPRKGNTPFLGSVRCVPGESVKIEIVPAEGALIVRQARCRQGTVRVDR